MKLCLSNRRGPVFLRRSVVYVVVKPVATVSVITSNDVVKLSLLPVVVDRELCQ